MKKLILITCICIAYIHGFAQTNVGIGTNNPQSTLDVSGAIGSNIITVTGATSLTGAYATVIATPSSAYIITLPGIASSVHRMYTIIYNGTAGGNTITIQGNVSGENIVVAGVSANTYPFTGGTITLQNNGTSWFATTTASSSGGTGYIQNQTATGNFSTGQSASYSITGSGQINSNLTVGNSVGIGTPTPGANLLNVANSAAASGVGNGIVLDAQQGGGVSAGGAVGIAAGNGSSAGAGGAGGAVTIAGGTAAGTGNNAGGAVNINAGSATGAGTAGTVNINAGNGASATTIGTGSTTGAVTIGGTGNGVNVGSSTTNTVVLGSTSSTTNINSGSGAVNVNAGNNQPTNINTGTSTGKTTIGGGLGTMALNVGSDVTGDIYYRNSSGNLARLGVGSTGQSLSISSGLPAWIGGSGTGASGYWTRTSTNLYNTNQGDWVGFGISSPVASRFDVQGVTARSGTGPTNPSIYFTGTLTDGTTGPAAGNIEFRHDNQSQGIGFGYQSIYATGSNSTQPLNLIAKGGAAITLNAYAYGTGYVGIGTTGPLGNLDVEATTANTYGHLVVNRNNSGAVGGELSINNLAGGTGAQAVLAFGTDPSTNFDGSGNNANNAEIRAWNTNSSTNSTDLRFSNWSGSAENVNMVITSAGYVGIGNSAPGYMFDVAGKTDIDGANDGAIYMTGTKNTYHGIEWNYASNDRYGMAQATGGNTAIYTSAAYSPSFISFDLANAYTSAYTELVRITHSGYVGIGTTNPTAPLYVGISNGSFNQGSYTYYANGSNGTVSGSFCTCNSNMSFNAGNSSCSGCAVAIYAAGRIEGAEFDANSDQRIKKDFRLSDKEDDLETLSKIEVTDFRYKDEVVNGGNFKKGFIAQQVKSVYPQAVSTHTDFVTDVYAMPQHAILSHGTLTITMKDIHGFCDGDEVRFVTPSGKLELPVKVKDDYTFIVNNWPDTTTQVFVYGKKTSDFMAVDYDRIYTLNVSVTQQLVSKVAALEKENEILINANSQLNEQNCDLTQKVDALASTNSNIQLLQKQLDDLKTLMEKNGIRSEK